MKKLLLILALGTFAACNNGTTATAVDSTANRIDSAADARIDSLQQRTDSLSARIDSTADAKIEQLKSPDSTKH